MLIGEMILGVLIVVVLIILVPIVTVIMTIKSIYDRDPIALGLCALFWLAIISSVLIFLGV